MWRAKYQHIAVAAAILACALSFKYFTDSQVEPVHQTASDVVSEDLAVSVDIISDDVDELLVVSESSVDEVQKAESTDAGMLSKDAYQGDSLLAIVLDDCGFNYKMAERMRSLDITMTWAIIPGQTYSRKTADMLAADGIPFLIHVPMQAYSDQPGKAGSPKHYAIGVGMSEEEVADTLGPIIDSLPGAYGINNHRGSAATEDAVLMGHVMKELASRSMFFLDSSVTSKTQAHKTAQDHGLDTLRNNFFLDNKSDRKYIHDQVDTAIERAKKRGSYITVCHLRPETLAFFESIDPSYFSDRGVRLVTLPEMIESRKEHDIDESR